MIKEERQYTQSGVIAERKTVCDICGAVIPSRATGWAYVQETKTPAQIRLMVDAGAREEFQHICHACWEAVKEEYLRPKRDGKHEQAPEKTDIPEESRTEPELQRKDRRDNRRERR